MAKSSLASSSLTTNLPSPVDVVAEQRRGILRHHAQTAVRQQSRLDQRLKTVADAEDKAAAVKQRVNFLAYILVVKYVHDKLRAAVRLVARREAAAKHENMGAADMLLHLGDRAQDVVAAQIAQYAGRHLGSRVAERLGRIVIAVRAGEYGQVGHRTLDGFALIGKGAACGFGAHHVVNFTVLASYNPSSGIRTPFTVRASSATVAPSSSAAGKSSSPSLSTRIEP